MQDERGQRRVRQASLSDAPRCREIYAPYVEDTVVSFEEEVPSPTELEQRMQACLTTHDWLVLEGPTGVLGYAYAGPYRTRAAYRWACEVSVYVDRGSHRAGAGRQLYEALFARLVNLGYLTAFAGMTLPNPASEGLHRSLGFEPIGTWRRVGWKSGAWHDVLWMQRHLAPGSIPPVEPGPPQTSR